MQRFTKLMLTTLRLLACNYSKDERIRKIVSLLAGYGSNIVNMAASASN
jgi:hypothetical protein